MGALDQHTQLIGRERERAELARGLTAIREGRGGLILLTGEAGVGKTSLAKEVLADSELLVLAGGASQDGTVADGPNQRWIALVSASGAGWLGKLRFACPIFSAAPA